MKKKKNPWATEHVADLTVKAMTGSGREHAVTLRTDAKGRYIVRIEGTPGSWEVEDVKRFAGQASGMLAIDLGQNWYVTNMNEIVDEALDRIAQIEAKPSNVIQFPTGGSTGHATKKRKTPAQLDREIAEALSRTESTVKCPSPEHPLYPELRHIRQVAHDTSWTASQLAKDAESAFRNGDCAKAAKMLEAAKRVIAKEHRKRR